MTIFLYGPDAYRLGQGVEQVVDGYKKKYRSGLNFFSFDLSDKEQRVRFEDSLKTVSFFEEAKLLVAKNAFSSKEISEWTRKTLAEQGMDKAKSVFVAVVEQASQKDLEKTNKPLFKDLASSATVRNFEYLEGVKLLNWIRAEFAARNCSIDSSAAKQLVALAGYESLRLANEIEKLANYKQKGVIGPKDIELLVAGRVDLNIFDLVDAVVSKNRARSYELLYRELKNGRDAHYLMAMMAYGFRSRAQRFSLEELKRAFGKLAEMDMLSKNGTANLVDSLFEFVMTS
jgi:DNA polymerase III delta subunit